MILFCDIDGVCHPLNARTDLLFSCTGRLWKILRDCPEVQLVVSSSWREQHSKAELIDFLTYGGGEDLAHRIIGVTPRTPRARSTYIAGPQPVRHNECEQWLIENGQQHRAWLALDDEALIFPQGSTTLYLVNGKTGLTEADTIAIIQRIKPAKVLSSGSGSYDRTVEHDSGVHRKSLDAGLAATGGGAAEGGHVSGGAGGTNGA